MEVAACVAGVAGPSVHSVHATAAKDVAEDAVKVGFDIGD